MNMEIPKEFEENYKEFVEKYKGIDLNKKMTEEELQLFHERNAQPDIAGIDPSRAEEIEKIWEKLCSEKSADLRTKVCER